MNWPVWSPKAKEGVCPDQENCSQHWLGTENPEGSGFMQVGSGVTIIALPVFTGQLDGSWGQAGGLVEMLPGHYSATRAIVGLPRTPCRGRAGSDLSQAFLSLGWSAMPLVSLQIGNPALWNNALKARAQCPDCCLCPLIALRAWPGGCREASRAQSSGSPANGLPEP